MKYSPEIIKRIEAFIAEMDKSASPDEFWKHCTVYHIAKLCDVCRDTIYAWQKEHPEFSDTIKKWETVRNAKFMELKAKQAHWIFLAKNWLEMTDKQEISGNADKPLVLKVEKVVTDRRPSEGADE